MTDSTSILPIERVEKAILVIRGRRVLLDADLADFYGVETRILTRAVQRNAPRFPEDFTFQSTAEEFGDLRSQSGISSSWGGRRYPPYAFTEQGVGMLSAVLHSDRAIQVSIAIIRAFIRMRQVLASHEDLATRLEDLSARGTASSGADGRTALLLPRRSNRAILGHTWARRALPQARGREPSGAGLR